MEFSKKLRIMRETAGLTQNQLAEKIIVSRQAVSNWENGKTEPDVNMLRRIASILQIEIKELFFDMTLEEKLTNLDWYPQGETLPLYEEFKQNPIYDKDFAVFKLVICLFYEKEYEKVCEIAEGYSPLKQSSDILFFYAAALDMLGEREKACGIYQYMIDNEIISVSIFDQYGIKPMCEDYIRYLLKIPYSPEATQTFYQAYHEELAKKRDSLLLQPYFYEDTSEYPDFTYDSSHPMLKELREKYALDEAAGDGDEISRFKNLLSWVHRMVGWDGANGIQADCNALSILAKAQADGTRFNCRGVGMVLSEVYLAMGYRSKFVVCLPYDMGDRDCHIVTHVYSETRKKWMMFDACYECWAENTDGTILSLPEIRYYYEKNLPLFFPETTNANGVGGYSERYKDYLRKNIYRFECHINSSAALEDKERLYMASLIPGEYGTLGYTEAKKTYNGCAHGTHSYHKIITSNPVWFWQK